MNVDTGTLGRHELHDLMGNAITPLPIALISTVGENGSFNAAPFSFVAPVVSKPPIVCVSLARRQGQKKDTLKNIETSQDFVINIVDENLIKQAVQASGDFPSDVDEIKLVGLTPLKSEKVKSPRIGESKINLECKLLQTLEFIEEGNGLRSVVFGQVVQIHVKDEICANGGIDPARLQVVGRVGRNAYIKAANIFEVKRS